MTIIDFLLIVVATITMHRFWNYETSLAGLRKAAEKLPLVRKPLLCPSCNAFWFGVATVAIWKFSPSYVLVSVASFGILQGLTWLYTTIPIWMKKIPQISGKSTPAKKEEKPVPSTPVARHMPVQNAERTVIILTALSDFRSSYSVAGDALNEARAIGMVNPTWDVQLWVQQGAKEGGWEFMPSNVSLRKLVPRVPLVKGEAKDADSALLKGFLQRELQHYPHATVITHDLLFVSWYAVFARAIHELQGFPEIQWFHFAHSLPGERDAKSKWLTTLPSEKHKIVTVAEGQEDAFASYYSTSREQVLRIPNVKDPRTWGTMSDEVRKIVTKTRLWEHNIVQIFPSCSTRLTAKGLVKVIQAFALLNEKDSAFLLICNPNAQGEKPTKLITEMKKVAEKVGLPSDRYAFTSDLVPEKATHGLSADDIKTLMQFYGNLLLWPSVSEADSLVMLEARMTGQYIISNLDVPTLHTFADRLIPWGNNQGEDPPETTHFVYARVMEHFASHPDRRRQVLRTRNLEGIGNVWKSLLLAPRP